MSVDASAFEERHAERRTVRWQSDVEPRETGAVKMRAAGIGERVGNVRDVGQRAARVVLVLIRIAVRPASIASGNDRDYFVWRSGC